MFDLVPLGHLDRLFHVPVCDLVGKVFGFGVFGLLRDGFGECGHKEGEDVPDVGGWVAGILCVSLHPPHF